MKLRMNQNMNTLKTLHLALELMIIKVLSQAGYPDKHNIKRDSRHYQILHQAQDNTIQSF